MSPIPILLDRRSTKNISNGIPGAFTDLRLPWELTILKSRADLESRDRFPICSHIKLLYEYIA